MAGIKSGINGQINNNIVTDGLVFYIDPAYKISYPGTGTTIHDISRESSTDSSLEGNGTTFVNENQGIFDLDGSDDYIENPFYIPSSKNVTWGIWARSDISLVDFKWLWGTSTSSGGGEWSISAYDFGSTGQGTIRGRVRTLVGSPYYTSVITTSTPSIGEWFHITFTWDGSTMKIYYNGVEEDSESVSTYHDGGRLIQTMGTYIYNAGSTKTYEWNGQIGPSYIYNKGLSAGDVLQNYQAQKERFGL
jgi:hypothetical protein